MTAFEIVLLTFLVVCALAACLSKRLVTTVVVFMGYSLIMSVLWMLLQAPDLAITEAAVGAGITTVLFFVVLRRVSTASAKPTHSDGEGGGDSGE